MILTRHKVLTFLGLIVLQTCPGRANFLDASDELTCFDLCTNCNGTPFFRNNICERHVGDDDRRGAECIGRIKRQAEELGLGVVSCDLADMDADRAARCILKPLLGRAKSKNDVDLVAKYFMGDGSKGGLSSLLGSFKPPTDNENSKSQPIAEDSKSTTGAENVGASFTTSDGTGKQADEESGLDAINNLNPLDRAGQLAPDLLDVKPLLGAAAAWLQPSNLVAIGNGLQGVAPSAALLGQQYSPNFRRQGAPDLAGYRSEAPDPMGIVGSPNGIYNQQTAHTPGTNFGMLPYGYYLGAPNPMQNQLQAASQVYPMQNQLQAASQVYPMQSYVDNYNAMVAAPNPFITGPNYNMGPFPYFNYPNFGAQPSNFADSNKAAAQIVGEPNPMPSSEPRTYYEPEVEENELENVADAKSSEAYTEEIKDQSPKLRKSRFKSKDSLVKVENSNREKSNVKRTV